MSNHRIDILERALKRQKAARKIAEKILEDKSRELYLISEELKAANIRLEASLIEKSSQLKGVFDNINDSYLIMSLSGDVLKMNDAAIALFGYDISKEKLNAKNLIYPEDATYAFESFYKLYNTGSFSNYIARVLTKKKEVKWVQINASLIYDKNDKKIAAQGIIRDITATKRTTELIAEQKKELDVIVENSSLGIALIQQGRFLKTNRMFQELLGYSVAEFSKLTIKDIFFKGDYAFSKEYLDKMNSGAIDNFVLEKKYKRKNGTVLWVKANVNAVRNAVGSIKYEVVLVEDVTLKRERKLIINMINDLAKSILGKDTIYEIAWEVTQKIATYLDSEDCVIFLVNHKNNTLEQVASHYLKLDKKNIKKNSLEIGKGIAGNVAKSGKAEIIKDTSKDARYVVEGERRFSEISVPIISEGKVIGVIDSEHIDKNHYTQEHLHVLENIASLVSMQLKSAINRRQREKAEIENLELLSQLEKSNDELNEYAHIVSHDLKSPLRSIDALVSWIKTDNKGSFDTATLANFKLIEGTLQTMENLISNILEYSSAGTETSEKKQVDLNLIINTLRGLLFIPDHILIKVPRKLPTINGDATKFQQLFQNLISNAVKFNDKEKGLIEIEFIEQTSFYQFSVKDNGIGIDKKYHDKIFKIFQALNKREDSTGIGLSIVKKIIQLYEGTIWLVSKPGVGTTFYFTIKK
ncbi:PAS domain S-box protein [Tenacibaculum finnmarkense]|uniref:histidine kinase n=1 Tax=Tenacibaculum finnmarkense genomovar ulcerans TaxID=2781388 RepID=A0A2I2MB13_9FLAO|nr:PAS domain S-box protein [Tenacibaculum finnmarkense]MBE7633807.1 PAS domain S-box protein [Tenacibaculum finnmarkense genomovar ulcerans]MBE7647884.1 PAS domain S-box protein [Tenacibaculum finnmarkense genomovar ulcerans]MBE7697772.1 PAS domain S-box protein [Tenacibaculum finnmarkense genomovar ulcerans]MCD8399979.1 PAS domain S-box protein [Tenacibaculum finnmarkense genomovar ulcerans]MCD8410081.1 PAS domain S-box protein [Tenacibaculum finnmarkense genomovar ulcerans]